MCINTNEECTVRQEDYESWQLNITVKTQKCKREELKTSGDAGKTRWMLWRQATLCSQACYLWHLAFQQKTELFHYTSTAQLLAVRQIRQYSETNQQWKMETTKIVSCSYSQLNQHICRLAAAKSAINDDRRCRLAAAEDSTLGACRHPPPKH